MTRAIGRDSESIDRAENGHACLMFDACRQEALALVQANGPRRQPAKLR
jgi:hypothetical protein